MEENSLEVLRYGVAVENGCAFEAALKEIYSSSGTNIIELPLRAAKFADGQVELSSEREDRVWNRRKSKANTLPYVRDCLQDFEAFLRGHSIKAPATVLQEHGIQYWKQSILIELLLFTAMSRSDDDQVRAPAAALYSAFRGLSDATMFTHVIVGKNALEGHKFATSSIVDRLRVGKHYSCPSSSTDVEACYRILETSFDAASAGLGSQGADFAQSVFLKLLALLLIEKSAAFSGPPTFYRYLVERMSRCPRTTQRVVGSMLPTSCSVWYSGLQSVFSQPRDMELEQAFSCFDCDVSSLEVESSQLLQCITATDLT